MAQLTIIHYNDIYNIEPNSSKEPIGGAARFLTAIKSFSHLNPLVLFSGDAFSPSMRKYSAGLEVDPFGYVISNYGNPLFFIETVSTFTKGEQMIPVLNKVGTHCAVLGNHDFGRIEDIQFVLHCCNKTKMSISIFQI